MPRKRQLHPYTVTVRARIETASKIAEIVEHAVSVLRDDRHWRGRGESNEDATYLAEKVLEAMGFEDPGCPEGCAACVCPLCRGNGTILEDLTGNEGHGYTAQPIGCPQCGSEDEAP